MDDRSSLPRAQAAQRSSALLIVASVLMAVIAVVSFLPLHDKVQLHTKGRFHSIGHLLAFAAVAFVLNRYASTTRWRWILCGVALLFGYGIEFGQHALYHENVEQADLVFDTAGVVLGSVFGLLSRG